MTQADRACECEPDILSGTTVEGTGVPTGTHNQSSCTPVLQLVCTVLATVLVYQWFMHELNPKNWYNVLQRRTSNTYPMYCTPSESRRCNILL